MKIMVTGAAGFLGCRLIQTFLNDMGQKNSPEAIIALDLTPCPISHPCVDSRAGSITDPAFIRKALEDDVEIIYHLAAILSGQAEAEFDTGMTINIDATRLILEQSRCLPKPPRFVFTSSLAVFGGPMPKVVPENMAVMPQSSYGTEKAIGELLVCEFTRRGFIDGIVCRLPTISVRPGLPNSAASSFVSGMIREPLAGRASECPVPLETRLWISSPDTITQNLLQAGTIPSTVLGQQRILNLPGISVSAAEMLDSLERWGGMEARRLVRLTQVPAIMDIVCSWPGAFDIHRSLELGFKADTGIDSIIKNYMENLMP